ncbi:MAG: CHAT domain-containing protein [Candidatus Hermodarchaeota archaeon]
MESLMANKMEGKTNILDLTINYDIDESYFQMLFNISIGGDKKVPETIKVSRQFFITLLKEIAQIYKFYETVRLENQHRAISLTKKSEPAKDFLSNIYGTTTKEKLETIGKKIYQNLFPNQIRRFIKEYSISTIFINSEQFLIPFELMYDGESFLATRIEFYRKHLFEEREKDIPIISSKTKELPTTIVFFTNPTEDLVEAEREVTQIIKFFQEKKDLNFKIDECACKGANYHRLSNIFFMPRLDIFHYSGHSLKEKDDIYFHLLDHPLSVNDISLQYPTLFYLNMCEADMTVQDRIDYEGYKSLNFPRAIMKRGAKGCIATIWPIIDKTAAEFAIHFYKQVLENESFGKAICSSKKRFSEISNPNDITWMSFVLYGDPTNSYLKGISEEEIQLSDTRPQVIVDERKKEIPIIEQVAEPIANERKEEILIIEPVSESIGDISKKEKVPDIKCVYLSEKNKTISLTYSRRFSPSTKETQVKLEINKKFLKELIKILGRVDSFRLIELNKKNLIEIGSKLYSQLIPNPIQNKLNSSDSKIIELTLDSDLLQYPWELLYDGKQFLGIKYSIGRHIIQKNQKIEIFYPDRGLREGVRFLIVGDPLNIQKGSRDEAVQLNKQLSKIKNVETKILVGKEANSNNFTMELQKDYDFLHYCGNAIFNINNPDESGILLNDGALKISSINNILRSKPPILAFINAEETRLEQTQNPLKYEDQVNGLAIPFLLKGINYIGSMLPTHNASAIAIELFFYYEVLKGQPIGEALRRAKEYGYKRAKEKQLSWASYTLYGDPTISLREI